MDKLKQIAESLSDDNLLVLALWLQDEWLRRQRVKREAVQPGAAGTARRAETLPDGVELPF